MDGIAGEVRGALLAHGFTMTGVLDVLGEEAFGALGRGITGPARYALAGAGDSPLIDLVRLFLLGEPVPHERAEAAMPLPAAVALGLIGEPGGAAAVRAQFHVQPYPTGLHDAYVVSDFPRGRGRTGQSLPPQHVTGIGGASVTLAALTPRRRVARTLDLGTGCGVEALLAAGHSDEVVATDISDRALRCAALTAALSAGRFGLRRGSLYEPVAGERFDLIVANPPFVIAAAPRLVYREAPQRGDDLSRAVIAQTAQHLAPGGTAVVLCNWLHLPGQPWQERLAGWAPPGCQMWVAERERLTASEYVELWLQDSGELDGPGGDERFGAWLRYFEELGAEAVGFGWVVLRESDHGWFAAQEVAGAERLPTGEEVLEQLGHYDTMHRTTAPRLLAAEVSWAPGVELDRCWQVDDAVLPQVFVSRGWAPAIEIDPVLVGLLAGDGTVSERIEQLAGADADEADDLTVRALLGLRRLLGAGMVQLDAPDR